MPTVTQLPSQNISIVVGGPADKISLQAFDAQGNDITSQCSWSFQGVNAAIATVAFNIQAGAYLITPQGVGSFQLGITATNGGGSAQRVDNITVTQAPPSVVNASFTPAG